MRMSTRAMYLGVMISLLWVGLAPTVAAADEAQLSLSSQGWRIVEQPAGRAVQLTALAANEGTSALAYRARFAVETREAPRRLATEAEAPWTLLQTVALPAGELAPGATASLDSAVPYGLLPSGKAYRFRVELLSATEDRVLAEAVLSPEVTSLDASMSSRPAAEDESVLPPLLAAETGTVRARTGTDGRGDDRAADRGETPRAAELGVSALSTAGGWGLMVGTHTAVRSGGQWVENGSGTIDVLSNLGLMRLNYTYHASGTSAATLQATATATGTLRTLFRKVPVTISTASAQMRNAGNRHQTTNRLHQIIVTRTECTATGTFVGTIDGKPWRGVLTLTHGVQTLNLTTHVGSHVFEIRFTASK